jgi:hypothetical protein
VRFAHTISYGLVSAAASAPTTPLANAMMANTLSNFFIFDLLFVLILAMGTV